LAAASSRVCLSQSAVSEQIRKLEDYTGTILLSRSKRGAALTPVGERLLAHARRLLAASEAAFHDVQGRTLAGDLRLAITDYYRPSAIAALLKQLNDRYPHLRLHVTVMKSALIRERDSEGEFDVGLCMQINPTQGVPAAFDSERGWLIGQENLSWVTSADQADTLSPPWPLVILPASCSLHQYIIGVLESAQVPFVIAHTASGVAGVQLALTAGLGLSCLNASALCPGLVRLRDDVGLPTIPNVEFRILPPRSTEPDFITAAREMLVHELAGVLKTDAAHR